MDEEIVNYKHQMPAQLRFSDVDQFGHVNNSVYFALFDMCKTRYVLELLGEDMLTKTAIVVASIHADFISPIFYPDEIAIQSKVTHLGNKSFIMTQRAINVRTQDVKCICKTVMVTYDPVNKCSVPIPDEFREKITQYESEITL